MIDRRAPLQPSASALQLRRVGFHPGFEGAADSGAGSAAGFDDGGYEVPTVDPAQGRSSLCDIAPRGEDYAAPADAAVGGTQVTLRVWAVDVLCLGCVWAVYGLCLCRGCAVAMLCLFFACSVVHVLYRRDAGDATPARPRSRPHPRPRPRPQSPTVTHPMRCV